MKRTWLGLILLLAVAIIGDGCVSPDSPPTTKVADRPDARPPATGTNIPRQRQDRTPENKTKRPGKAETPRVKAKPTPPPGPPEEVVTRGGFR